MCLFNLTFFLCLLSLEKNRKLPNRCQPQRVSKLERSFWCRRWEGPVLLRSRPNPLQLPSRPRCPVHAEARPASRREIGTPGSRYLHGRPPIILQVSHAVCCATVPTRTTDRSKPTQTTACRRAVRAAASAVLTYLQSPPVFPSPSPTRSRVCRTHPPARCPPSPNRTSARSGSTRTCSAIRRRQPSDRTER